MSVATKEAATPYEQHYGYVLGVLAGRCPWVPRSDRQALYHEAYAAMLELERAGRLDPAEMHPRQLRVYLAKAAVRNALDERKRAETRLTVPLGPAAENRADPARPVDERVAGALDAQAIRELLAELVPRQRAVLQLRFALELEPVEIQRLLGISARAYRKDLERGVRQLSGRYELVREGRWCETRRSLVLAYVAGIAGPRKALAARSHLAACPGCAQMAGELRQATQRAAALLPVPDVVLREGSLQRLGEMLAGAREHVADVGGGVKQQAMALANRASDPTPLAGARPGAAAAAIAGCLAIGSGATYCAVEGVPDSLRAPLGLERRVDETDGSAKKQRRRDERAHATQAQAPSPVVVDPPADEPQAERPAPTPEPVGSPPPEPEPAPPTAAEQANREFGIEQTGSPSGTEFGAASQPDGSGRGGTPGGEFGP
jgi:RNA polymerase sigma factor (sigma-70 family)